MAINVPDEYGFVNNADYHTNKKDETGKQVWQCPFYRMWYDMKRRVVYQHKGVDRAKYRRYFGTTICEEWKYFMTFKRWVEDRLALMGETELGKLTLDKDIINTGNKHYSPENCCLVENRVNVFFTKSDCKRGKYPLGVHWCNTKKVFVGQCKDGIRKAQVYLGYFDNPEEPHKKWQELKAQVALRLSTEVKDPYAAAALVRVHNQLLRQAEAGEITVTF